MKSSTIIIKSSTLYDVSNLPKPSWIKGNIACHCSIIFICSFQKKVFSVNTSFYRPITVLFILFTVRSYPSHLRLAVLKPMALVRIHSTPEWT